MNWNKLKTVLLDLFYIVFILCSMLAMVFCLLWLGFTLIAKANEPEPPVTEEVVIEVQEVTRTMEDLIVPEEPTSAEVPDEPFVPEADWAVQEQLAVGIYREGGGDSVCDDCRVRIADVMLNRVADPRFPDTLKAVLTQKGQYGTMHTDGITFPKRAAQPEEFHAVERAYDIAEEVMGGRHSELYGQGYIYQSEFPDLGHDAVQHCGIYFAKG